MCPFTKCSSIHENWFPRKLSHPKYKWQKIVQTPNFYLLLGTYMRKLGFFYVPSQPWRWSRHLKTSDTTLPEVLSLVVCRQQESSPCDTLLISSITCTLPVKECQTNNLHELLSYFSLKIKKSLLQHVTYLICRIVLHIHHYKPTVRTSHSVMWATVTFILTSHLYVTATHIYTGVSLTYGVTIHINVSLTHNDWQNVSESHTMCHWIFCQISIAYSTFIITMIHLIFFGQICFLLKCVQMVLLQEILLTKLRIIIIFQWNEISITCIWILESNVVIRTTFFLSTELWNSLIPFCKYAPSASSVKQNCKS